MIRRALICVLTSALVLIVAQVGRAKPRVWPRKVFDAYFEKHARNPGRRKMLRAAATRQFRDLTWDTRTMTAPKEGVARNYTFLVTTFPPDGGNKYLVDRDALSRRPLFFASVISDLPALHIARGKWSAGTPKMRTHTFYNLGFVLEAKPAHVVANSADDTAFKLHEPHPSSLKELRKRVFANYGPAWTKVASETPTQWPHYKLRRVGPFTPKHILDRTTERNNELLLHGTYGACKVQPAALLVRTDALTGQDLVEAADLAPYVAAARRWKIPIVRVPAYPHVHNEWTHPRENARHRTLLMLQLQRALRGDFPLEDWRKKIWQ